MRTVLMTLVVVGCGSSQSGGDAIGDERPVWLAGTWRVGDEPGREFELWGATEGGGHIGLGVQMEPPGPASGMELMWIEPGARALVAMPGGRRTRFARTEAGDRSLRFEAPTHDSPKWIRYQAIGDGLQAAIGDDADPSATWRFQRVPGDPIVRQARFEVCRRGDTMEVGDDGCYCGAQLACGVVDDPLPLRVGILDSSCDACMPVSGECPYDSAMALADGECAPREAITLFRTDLR